MPDDLPGPPDRDRDTRPGERPTEPLGGPPTPEPPAGGQPPAPAGQTWPEAPPPPAQGYGQAYGTQPGYGQPGYGQPGPYGAPPSSRAG